MTKILLIDDDLFIHELATLYLEQGGYQVLTADSGPKGLELAAQYGPDLILLDIAMPHMDGFKVLQTLKNNAETSDIPVLFFTSFEHKELEQEAQAQNAISLINKSIDMKSLNATIHLAIHHPEFLQ